MIDGLRQAMSAAGYDLGATELLDVLWLARVMEGRGAPEATGEPGERVDEAGAEGDFGGTGAEGEPDGRPGAPPDAAAEHGDPANPATAADATEATDSTDATGSSDSTDPAGPSAPVTPAGPPRRALYAMGSQGGGPAADRARPARVPGGRALPDAQQLGRALRPLRRPRDHPHRTVPDVEATVRLAAETGFLDVVSRPDQEQRWSAVLLVDCSPSMQVWGSLAAELRALLARSTVFRSVDVHLIDPRDPACPLRGRGTAHASLTFLLTDGTHHGWRSPQAVRALTAWGRGGPVAVLNPLPRRLWRGTALDARPRLLAAPGEFDPVGRLVVCDALSGERDPEADGLLALPVLNPTASALEQWAGLLTRPGVPHLIETVLLDEAPLHAPPPRPHGTAEELLAHFRGAFSPEAYRLAVRLSAIRPLTTPLMQLVRVATMRDAGPTHVAEILLGGLLERTERARGAAAAQALDRALGPLPPGRQAQPVYDFRPGVRELLFSGLGAEQAVEVVEAVGRSLEPYMGRLPDFPVLMGDEEGELRLDASARAFAVLASPVLERMGGAAPEPGNGALPQPRRPVAAPDPGPVAALPPAPEHFFGRTEEIAALVAGLTGADGPAPCWAVHGPPGAGKTALALRVAHEVAGHFPDGQYFVGLRDAEPEHAAQYRSLLAAQRVLLVVDDVPEDGEALAALLPQGRARSGAVLVTGLRRPRVDGLTGSVELAGMTAVDAHRALPEHLLLRWLDDRLTPLARRAFCLLAVPDGTKLSLPAAAAVLDTTVDQARDGLAELLAIGALRTTACGHYRYTGELRSFARGIADRELPGDRRDELLSRLLTCYLATGRALHESRYPGDGWWSARARASPSAADPDRALAAWADEMPQALAVIRQTAVRPGRSMRLASYLLLLAQVVADSGALSAAYEAAARAVAAQAAREGDHKSETRARVALADAYIARGRFDRAAPEALTAEDLARRSGDPLARFRAPYARGIIALHQGQHNAAERHLTAAWECCRTHHDQLGEAAALAALARVWAATGNGEEAVLFAERSVGIYRRSGGGTPRLAHGLYALSEALSSAGRHTDALHALSEALPLFEKERQYLWAGRTRCRTAEAMAALIRPAEAVSAAQDAAKRLLVPGGERWRADALAVLGHAETALGRKQGAQAHWREALAVYEEFGAPEAEGMRALLRDKAGPPASASRRPGVSRSADRATTGTVLRDLTAAVATLRDGLRLSPKLSTSLEQGGAPLTGRDNDFEAIEAELAALLADFTRTGRPPRAALERLLASLETAASDDALAGASPDVREAAATVHVLTRRLAP
ncbi:SAV_2336 N-terminal domain-related protein [Streptomyces chattanoogensis]|uniref:SAV_2336 N-terminal domain-related protein n=1 Tax=Streptomyces chattanoogensis TaxID=66876 RepID=UPI0036BA5761